MPRPAARRECAKAGRKGANEAALRLSDRPSRPRGAGRAKERFGRPSALLRKPAISEIPGPSLTRAGRLDVKISVDPTDRAGRIEIIRNYLDGITTVEQIDVEGFAGQTTGLTPADLKTIITRRAPARALFAGNAAHSVLPLSQPLTAALGTLFALTAHIEDWPVARGGSRAIAAALAGRACLQNGGGVRSVADVEALAAAGVSRVVMGSAAVADPDIVVCGLNPHAGEGGHLGTEEITTISPVLEALREEGISTIGPLPADTLFTPRYLEEADAILAMYHDQGLPVLKHMGFGRAVNITLGIPLIRTSVDHGTALDLAGTGEADAGSLMAAIEYAHNMIQQTGNDT